MPQPSAPASAIALTIAAKQRTSKVFDDSAPLRRPSACAADQQTQMFAKNLRTQVPRSPSLSQASRSSSSLASQPQSRAPLNYMRATSSSRRRSRNAHFEDNEQTQLPQTQPPSMSSTSVSRLRSQSPYRSTAHYAPSHSITSVARRAPPRQGPPLPTGRPHGAYQASQVEHHVALRHSSSHQQREDAPVADVASSWRAEKRYLASFPQQLPRQKPQSLSSSWTVQDPLTSANNANIDVLEPEDSIVQLDASDQREVVQLMASFELNGLPQHQGMTNSQGVPGKCSFDLQTALAEGKSSAQGSDGGANLRPGGCGGTKGVPLSTSIPDGMSQRRSTEHKGRREVFAQHSQAAENSEKFPDVARRSLQQNGLGLNGASGGTGAVNRRASTENAVRPGVAPSAFGEYLDPTQRAHPATIWRVVDILCWCTRFALVLIVCTWRLLNTSYDSWSASHFTESFKAMLSSGSFLRGQPKSSQPNHCMKGNDANATVQQQPLLPLLRAASVARIPQRQQQLTQQQHLGHWQAVNQKVTANRPDVVHWHPIEAETRKAAVGGPPLGAKLLEKRLLLLKVLLSAGVALCAGCWLLNTAQKEEFGDFDFM